MIQLGITIKGEHFMHQEPPMQMEKTITVDEEHYFKYFASFGETGDSNKIIELFETGYSPVFYPFVMTEDYDIWIEKVEVYKSL